MQPLYGIDEDSFYLDEFLSESLLDYLKEQYEDIIQ